MINSEDIDRLLDMSRLEISSESRAQFISQISDIIGYIDTISELDTSSVDDRESVFDTVNVFRDDSINPGLTASELRKYTANFLDGYYAVPKILAKGE